ncbi:hypothetical protein HID58_055471, partial [Brassica napus]
PWSKGHVADFQPLIDVTDGVASIQILDEIYANPEPLWRSFVVGHFIGDAPHVGSIHATVNRIWTMARDGSKIDVQFIEKNTVLFRIENAILRDKNAVADLLRDLECFYPILQEGGSGHKGTETNVEFSVGEVNLEKMIVQENTEERGQEITVQKETEWAVINGGTRSSPISDMVNGEASSSSVSATETVVSPSRFTVLTTLDEDIEDTEVEEGEVVSENEHIGIADSERPKDKEEHHNRRGKSVSVAAQKSTKKKVMRSRDLKSALSRFHHKLKTLKQELRALNRNNFGNITERTKQAFEALCICQNQVLLDPSPANFAAAEELSNIWNKLAAIKEKIFRQKSCIKWLQAGDHNTAFSIEQFRPDTQKTQLSEGVTLTSAQDIKNEVVLHFQRFLQQHHEVSE